MNIRFLTTSEKKKLLAQLKERFGITELEGTLFETGREKIRLFTGSLSPRDILALSPFINIELIGLYLCRQEHETRVRLSFDATHLFASQLSTNIVELNDMQLHSWLRGEHLDIPHAPGIVLICHTTDFLGCGISTGERILNHVPKERRLRK